MSIEELMKPRYKVIAEYPKCPFEIGMVLKQDMDTVGEVYVLESEVGRIGDKNYVMPQYVEKYAHLFSPLPWYAERAAVDFTGYVKLKLNEGTVVIEITGAKFLDKEYMKWKFGGTRLNDFLPATLAEYDQYISQSNK